MGGAQKLRSNKGNDEKGKKSAERKELPISYAANRSVYTTLFFIL